MLLLHAFAQTSSLWNLACAASLCTSSGAFDPPPTDTVHAKALFIFLTLHMPSAPTRPSSPTANYDAMYVVHVPEHSLLIPSTLLSCRCAMVWCVRKNSWPAAAEEKMPPLMLPMSIALSSSPLSPTKASASSGFRSPPSGSPKSPRSPRSPSPLSPRSPTTPRSPKAGNRMVRTAHPSLQGQHQQTCNSIRHKLPVLLRLISSDVAARESHARLGDPCEDFFVTAADVDWLQLILRASIGQAEATISQVYPHWVGEGASQSTAPHSLRANAGAVLNWLQTVITADETATPLLPQHTVSRQEMAAQPELGTLFSAHPPSAHHPRNSSYKKDTLASLALNRHITVNSSNRTIIHHVLDNASEGTAVRLLYVQIHNCSRVYVYLLGPYSYCSITGCNEAEVNLGAVRG